MVRLTSADIASLVQESIELGTPTARPRETVIRSLPEPARFNLVHIITGMRRCGKTFYLFQLIHELMGSGIPANRIFYFDFSDARLKPTDAQTLESVVDEYWRLVPEARDEGCYLFLDEVQECPDWQGFCQRIAEHERVTLTITGSSSRVSSDEIATNFRGRAHVHEMWPLSFREFCAFRDIAVPAPGQRAFSPQARSRYESAFDDYLLVGGFPAVQQAVPADRIELLQGYVRDVVARDVAERMGREDITLATQLALFGIRNTGCELSVNGLVEQLEEAGDQKVYWTKVNRLLELFGKAYLLHYLPEYTTALKPGTSKPKKVYAEDQGLAYAVSRANQQDVGKRLETAIYLELRRRNAGRRTDTVTSLTVPKTRQQVDFLLGDALASEPCELIQVTVGMERKKTRARELGSLEAGMRHAGLSRGVVITLREQGKTSTESGDIDIVPAWQWALQTPGASAE